MRQHGEDIPQAVASPESMIDPGVGLAARFVGPGEGAYEADLRHRRPLGLGC
jgi:hypothetical protein